MQMGPPTHRTTTGMLPRHASLTPTAMSAAGSQCTSAASKTHACFAVTGHTSQLMYTCLTNDRAWCRINGGYKGVDFVGNIACPNIDFATLHVCELLCLLIDCQTRCTDAIFHAMSTVPFHDARPIPILLQQCAYL